MIRRFAAVCLALAPMVGCDDRPEIPVTVAPPSNRAEDPVKHRPTTQELSQTKQESLSVLPLTVTVPQSWHVASELGQTVLKGYTPHSEVRIALISQGKMSEDALNRLLDGAKRESAKPEESGRFKFFDIREQNGLRVLEQQRTGPTDATLGTPLHWTIWFYLRNGDSYEIFNLNSTDLSWEDFQKDEQFLRAIILSVKPTGA
jgi:hypothetical protein